MKILTPEQKQINKLTRELRSLYSQLSYTQIARDQWRKKCAAKDEKGGRSAAIEIAGLREARARDLARYQEHLSQKVRALEANKVTIADMNIELADLRKSYDAKREHANALAAELARHIEARRAVPQVTRAMLEAGATAIATHWAGGRGAGSSITLARLAIEAAELARHVEARKAAGRPHPKGTRIDTPKNWALLNQRDEQWISSFQQWISSLQQWVWSAQNLMEKGPTPPAAGIYREVPDPADGNVRLERYDDTKALAEGVTPAAMRQAHRELKAEGVSFVEGDGQLSRRATQVMGRDLVRAAPKVCDPVPGGNGVWYRKRKKARNKGKGK